MATLRKRGNRWQVQVRRNGHSPLSRSFLHRTDAEKWARSIELDQDRTLLPSDPRILSRFTLGDLVHRYMDTVTPRKRRHEIERIELKAFLRYPICAKKVSELRTADFAAYRDIRLKQIKPTSLKRSLAPIRHLFEVARTEWGLPIFQNPVSALNFRAIDTKRERRLRSGELEQLLEEAAKCRNPHIDPIIRFAVATGMRRSEILNIEAKHFNLERSELVIPSSKTGMARTIPLTKDAFDILSRLSFEGKIFPLSANAFRLSLERVRKRAGLFDLHFHDLRHEALSRYFEIGLTAPEICLISGHQNLRTLARYSHAAVTEIRKKFWKQQRNSSNRRTLGN
jgi:integrase